VNPSPEALKEAGNIYNYSRALTKDKFIHLIANALDQARREGRDQGLEEAAKVVDNHGEDFSFKADSCEKEDVSHFMDARTRSDMTASFAQTAQECMCIAEAVRALKEKK
jgi:hypothetical protein